MTLCRHSWSFVRQYLAPGQDTEQWPYNSSLKQFFDNNSRLTTDALNLEWESRALAEVFGHWCKYDSPSKLAHNIVGVILLVVSLVGIVGNGFVIVVFTWYRKLPNSSHTFIVNLAISDFLLSAMHQMASYSSFLGYWQFGRLACNVYGGLCGLFGLVSIVSLSFLAMERCLVFSIKPCYDGLYVTPGQVKGMALFTWFYCILCVVPPYFGWGSYVPEGLLTSCSFDYLTRDSETRKFFYIIFMLGFIIPLTIIVVSFSFIFVSIERHENKMIKAINKNGYTTYKASANQKTPGRFRHWSRRSDLKSAKIILLIISVFLISWTPYAIVAVVGQFGDPDLLTPWISYVACVFAKMSTMYNPLIYGWNHHRFRLSLRCMLGRNPMRDSMTSPGPAHDCPQNNVTRYSKQISVSKQSVKSYWPFRSRVVKGSFLGPPQVQDISPSSSDEQRSSTDGKHRCSSCHESNYPARDEHSV